jgi:DNA mismatch endonuclease, patch repair protein
MGTDVFSKPKRSEVMSRIRGRDNRSTERRLAALLRAYGVAGWRLRAPDVIGRPDVYFPVSRVAVFIDGCFWHGCPRCFIMPHQNRPFWKNKIAGNIKRDRLVTISLRKTGVVVLRLWEHDLERRTKRLNSALAKLRSGGP